MERKRYLRESAGLAAVGLIERHSIWPLAVSLPADGITQVNVRFAPRLPITAQTLSPPSEVVGQHPDVARSDAGACGIISTAAVNEHRRSSGPHRPTPSDMAAIGSRRKLPAQRESRDEPQWKRRLAALGSSPTSIGITEVRKRATAEFPVMTFALSPGSVTFARVQRRTAMQKAVAAIAVSAASTGLAAVLKRLASELPVMTFAVSPGSVTFTRVRKRTAMERAVVAFASSPEAVGIAEVQKVVRTRHPLVVAPSVGLPAAAFAAMLSREPRDVPLLAVALSPPQQSHWL